jgi:hypothetical protein
MGTLQVSPSLHQLLKVQAHQWNSIFWHKYLTMPTITPADALVKAADNLIAIISGRLPKNSVTADAVEQLMKIYKIKDEKATCEAQAQRVLRELVQAQRVMVEQQAQVPQPTSPKQNPASFPSFEVEDCADKPKSARGSHNIISQDDDSPPSSNTHQQRQLCMLMQDYMLHMIKHQDTPRHSHRPKHPVTSTRSSSYVILPTQPSTMTLVIY